MVTWNESEYTEDNVVFGKIYLQATEIHASSLYLSPLLVEELVSC